MKALLNCLLMTVFCSATLQPAFAYATNDINENSSTLNLAHADRPKKLLVARPTNTEVRHYVDSCLNKISEVSKLNYPEEIKGFYGSVQLSIEILSDGRVENVQIERSSGKKIIDDAAIHLIKLSAPFEAFPEGKLKDIDILSLTRIFSFVASDDNSFFTQ
ncbi:MAG: energy transducer TonB [Methylotenera sp.]